MTGAIRALFVSAGPPGERTLSQHERERLDIVQAATCEEARGVLRQQPQVDVVVCDLTLDDGNWWCVYQDMALRGDPAEMIVVTPRRGDDMSAILAHGVFAAMGQPLAPGDLFRSIESAAAHAMATA
jgi:DNA-binding NtrC family response regulator